VAAGSGPEGRYRAVLVSITRVVNVSPELMPFVVFRANIEKREPRDEDMVAIFNVHGTSSNFVVFLDSGKTADEVKEEMVPYDVVVSASDWNLMVQELETRALYEEAMGEE
jgi:hypothetical protein